MLAATGLHMDAADYRSALWFLAKVEKKGIYKTVAFQIKMR